MDLTPLNEAILVRRYKQRLIALAQDLEKGSMSPPDYKETELMRGKKRKFRIRNSKGKGR